MKRFIAFLFFLLIAAITTIVAGLYFFAHHALQPPQLPFEFTVKQGASLRSLSKQLAEAGLLPEANGLWVLGRVLDQATGIRAGTYRLEAAITPLELLQKLNAGEVIPVSITFIEGTTFADMLAVLHAHKDVKPLLKGVSPAEILQRIGAGETHPEGLFFPDTYHFAAGASDLDILKHSYQAMQKKLDEAWQQRAADLPYRTPYEVLIMASIIEKETGQSAERPLIGAVFINRLRLSMRLQTDPTVIYGMGARYDGNIRKRDLQTDTPYNTYTRDGLPPTPIAMPGWGSLLAAVQPAASDKLYFVGKGDGSHYFSRSLDEHNRAVAKYQLGR